MGWSLKPISEGSVSTEQAANRICSRRCGSAHSWRSGHLPDVPRVQSGAEVGCEHQPVLAVIWLVLMVAALATLGVGQPQWWWSWQLKSYRIH